LVVSGFVPIFTLVSWIACFWLGFQFGKGRSEQQRRLEVEDLERRFKIVDAEAAQESSADPVSRLRKASGV